MKAVQKRSKNKQKNQTNFSDFISLPHALPNTPADSLLRRKSKSMALFEVLRDAILQGNIEAGERLPASRILAKRFLISRASVVAAFEMLVAEGFAESKVGVGTFAVTNIVHLRKIRAKNDILFQEHEPRICSLGLSVPDQQSWDIFRKIVNQCAMRHNPKNYYINNPLGLLRLREAIAYYLHSTRGVQCDPTQILITSGTQQSLDLVMRALFSRPQTIVVENPGYKRAYDLFKMMGHRVAPIGVDKNGLDIEELAAFNIKNPVLFVTPSHQFPTGAIMTLERRLALINYAREENALIFEDDYDGEFRFEGSPLTALQGVDPYERVFYFGSFSKILFPSIRVGYVVVPKPYIKKITDLRFAVDRHDSTLEENALAEFILRGHLAAHLRRARKSAQHCRDALILGLDEGSHHSIQYQIPRQGLHLVLPLPQSADDENIVKELERNNIESYALSKRYFKIPVAKGIILGFSGFKADEFYQAGLNIGRILRQYDFA